MTTPPFAEKSWRIPVSSFISFCPERYAADATADLPPERLMIFMEQ
jgi:hypothetical protein